MPPPEALKTKEQLREYLAGAELQEVLRQTLSTILKRDELPTADSLVRALPALPRPCLPSQPKRRSPQLPTTGSLESAAPTHRCASPPGTVSLIICGVATVCLPVCGAPTAGMLPLPLPWALAAFGPL